GDRRIAIGPKNPERDTELRSRLKQLVAKRMRFGYRRLTVLLAREGMAANHKRVYRLYREERLAMRIRQRRRLRWSGMETKPAAMKPNQQWSIDFVSDRVKVRTNNSRISISALSNDREKTTLSQTGFLGLQAN